MFIQQHEIEAIVEDLIENTIVDLFGDSFSSKKECVIALEILKCKLEEFDTTRFNELFS